jgi:hypothetical protein
MASERDTPVIASAARLKDVMRHSRSTVNTPSEMLSRMSSVGVRAVFFVNEDMIFLVPLGQPGQGRMKTKKGGKGMFLSAPHAESGSS